MVSFRSTCFFAVALSLGSQVIAGGEPIRDNYPPESLAAGEEGSVGFTVTVTKEGRAKNCRVTMSSGFARLDKAACEKVEAYLRVTPARDTSGRATEREFSSKIVFSIPEDAKKNDRPIQAN